jgi:fructosamine-3-kinase
VSRSSYFAYRDSNLSARDIARAFDDVFAIQDEIAAGSAERLELYKLYHVLNHLNLFGSAYLDQALAILRRLTDSGLSIHQ